MEAKQPYTSENQSDQAGGGTRERGAEVAHEAKSEVGSVVSDAKHEAGAVFDEAKSGVRDVVDEARQVVHDEADKQTHTLSSSVRQLAGDLEKMGGGTDGETMASDYVERFGRTLSSLADRLDEGGVDGALDDLRDVARRHPGMFLTGAAASGFAMARVFRHADAPSKGQESTNDQYSPGQASGEGALTSYGQSQLRDGQGGGEVDLRQQFEEREGEAPRLQGDVQEWARP